MLFISQSDCNRKFRNLFQLSFYILINFLLVRKKNLHPHFTNTCIITLHNTYIDGGKFDQN